MQATNREQRGLQDKSRHCRGCYNDHYNQPGNSTTGFCWSLPSARIVTRFRCGLWDPPTRPFAFSEVKVLDCYHEPGGGGKRVYMTQLPVCTKRHEVIWLSKRTNEKMARVRARIEKAEAKLRAATAPSCSSSSPSGPSGL